ncbi:MTH1187 family thiamine-binding protein [Psychrobacillus sp. MER TA 17]|nr:MTH1187 family thiamine-binding protein [Psychrobacillus sp. MER TA 17]
MSCLRISGMSFNAGIFYSGAGFLACAYYDEQGKLHSWAKPAGMQAYLQAGKLIVKTMPFRFVALIIALLCLIIVPKIIPTSWNGLPVYTFFYLLFAGHFLFPEPLKKYHGAEHKVFSAKGRICTERLQAIKRADIRNRGCSTGLVVVYFLSVFLLSGSLSLFTPFQQALMVSSYAALAVVALYQLFHRKPWLKGLEKSVLVLSYWLQLHVTTKEPDENHLQCAISAYQQLGYVAFPENIKKRRLPRKENKGMAIADVSIIPIGTSSTSVSAYVAYIQQVLDHYEKEKQIRYELTPMSTLIEAELPVLFEVIQKIHEAPFEQGALRTATSIRIDDRRDQPLTMDGKRKSVQEKRIEQ